MDLSHIVIYLYRLWQSPTVDIHRRKIDDSNIVIEQKINKWKSRKAL